jgi:GT2 family glycosyltransferase
MNFACCVSRREIYDKVGRLDTRRYSFPGYFEDVDWTLRTRELGYRNLFEPRSIIIHYGSKGVATPEMKLKAEQARTRNIRRLEERWQDAPPVLFQVRDYDFDLSEKEIALVDIHENGTSIDVTPVLRRKRAELEREKELLEEARTSRGVTEENPLVSILIPTFNNAKILTELTLPSVLSQTYENIEVVIVGDGCDDDTAERISAIEDPRIRFFNLDERGKYPEEPMNRWRVAGAFPGNACIDMATGEWLSPLDDDDEFSADHVAALLDEALSQGYEMVYGKVLMEMRPGRFEEVGEFPPRHSKISRMAALYRADLGFFKYDVECWKLQEPGDWNMWRRMKECGVRIGLLDRVVGIHYLERSRFGA